MRRRAQRVGLARSCGRFGFFPCGEKGVDCRRAKESEFVGIEWTDLGGRGVRS